MIKSLNEDRPTGIFAYAGQSVVLGHKNKDILMNFVALGSDARCISEGCHPCQIPNTPIDPVNVFASGPSPADFRLSKW